MILGMISTHKIDTPHYSASWLFAVSLFILLTFLANSL